MDQHWRYDYPGRMGSTLYTPQQVWLDTWEVAQAIVPLEALEEALVVVEERVLPWVGDGICLSWSGGKDSQFLRHFYETRWGRIPGVQVLSQPDLEYPSLERWYAEYREPNIQLRRTVLDLEWLAAHPYHLFEKGDTNQEWRPYKWREQRAFYYEGGYTAMMMGRRLIEGNFCGCAGLMETSRGYRVVNPIYDWSNEYVLAYLRWYDVPIPPFYFECPQGFYMGCDTWASRRVETEGGELDEEATWRALYEEEPVVVERAAGYFPLAAKVVGDGSRAV